MAPIATAWAQPQVSARLGSGIGTGWGDPSTEEGFLVEMHLRSELLFGPKISGAFRFGPAVELRTDDFVTAEAAGGLAALLPIATGYPIVLTTLLGWASRPDDADASFAAGTVAWGYRSYNHHFPYGFGLQLYATGRADLTDPSRWQLTAGVEIDLLFLVAIPAIFVWQLLSATDPDEPGRGD